MAYGDVSKGGLCIHAVGGGGTPSWFLFGGPRLRRKEEEEEEEEEKLWDDDDECIELSATIVRASNVCEINLDFFSTYI